MMVAHKQQEALTEQAATHDRSRLTRITGWLLLAALLLLLGGLAVKVVASASTSAEMFTFPFQFDESEGMIVAETQLLDRGVDIYNKPTPDLFIAAPYPPMYYLLTWPVQHLIGPEPTFKIGRTISMLATLLAGAALFGVVFALTRDLLAGAISTATWLSLGLVTYWGSLVKPDMLALALGLCGIWWVLGRPERQVWWALLFFWGAFFTKQTAIAAGVAVVGWLLFTRPRTGIGMGAALAAGAFLPSLALDAVTQGGYFYHMYTLHDLPWFPGRFIDFTTGLIRAYGVFLVPGMLAILFAATLWLWSRFRNTPRSLPRDGALLLLFYFGLTLVEAIGTGTHGGNHNHMLDWVAASCIGVGVGIGLVRASNLWPVRAAGVVAALWVLVQVPALFHTPQLLAQEFNMLSPEYREGMQNVFQYVTNNGGQAYSDNVGLLVLTHKQLWSTDPFTQTHATPRGRWDESRLVAAIRARQFSQVIFRIDIAAPDAGAGDVSPGILQAVRDNYKLDQRNVENIYVPK